MLDTHRKQVRVNVAWVVGFQITLGLTDLGFHSEGDMGLTHDGSRGS